MNSLTLSLMRLGATLTIDLWALFLKRAFIIAAPNYCLVGRWLRTMPEGTFRHSSIASTPQKSAECIVGWIAALIDSNWLQHPTLIQAIIFGIVTVLISFFIMQPAFARIGFIKNIKSYAGKTS